MRGEEVHSVGTRTCLLGITVLAHSDKFSGFGSHALCVHRTLGCSQSGATCRELLRFKPPAKSHKSRVDGPRSSYSR